MGLETGTYINSLDAANPASTDGLSQADDHFRLIKSTIKNTFPSITGAVTTTHAELNVLTGFTGATADINKIAAFTGTAADLNVLSGHAAEFEHVVGVTSAIQTQLDGKAAENGSTTEDFDAELLKADRVSLRNSDGVPSWTIRLTGSTSTPTLEFVAPGGLKMKLDSSGNLTVAGDVTAFGTL